MGGLGLAALLVAGMAAGSAAAADLFWAPDGSLGGAGRWDLDITANWSQNSDGSGPYVPWTDLFDRAIFAGTPGTVELYGDIHASRLTFDSKGYELYGGSLTLIGNSAIRVTGVDNEVTARSKIIGEVPGSSIVIEGGGTLVVTGDLTTAGDVRLNGSKLVLDRSALDAPSGGVLMTDQDGTGASLAVSGLNAHVNASWIEMGKETSGGNVALTVDGVAQVNLDEHLHVARDLNQVATINVSGGGTKLTARSIRLQHQKSLTFEVKDGGRVSTSDFQLGEGPDTPLDGGETVAAVTVSGEGSILEAGTVRIRHRNAEVNVLEGASFWTGDLQTGVAGEDTRGVLAINVAGTDAKWVVGNTASLNYGTLGVWNGGTFDAATAIVGGTAQIQISRTGKFDADKASLSDAAQVVITNGGQFSAVQAAIDGNAVIAVSGGTLALTAVEFGGASRVLVSNQGWLTGGGVVVSDAARVRIEGDSRFAAAAAALFDAAKVDIVGSQFHVSGGSLWIDGKDAALTVSDGGTVTAKTKDGGILLGRSGSGTLNIGAAEGDAARAAGVVDVTAIMFSSTGATLIFNHTNEDYKFDAPLEGASGSVRHYAGTTVLTADNSNFVGQTLVLGGTLQVDRSLGGQVIADLQGRLTGNGAVASLENAGVVAPGQGENWGTLTVTGNYVGSGGTVEIKTSLGGDGSPTDRLVIQGDTSGKSFVRVVNRGGQGAQTVECIRIIEVRGRSEGVFTLIGDYTIEGEPAVTVGAYAYRLFKNSVSNPHDGNWYLRSQPINSDPGSEPEPLYQPGVPLYESYAGVLQQLNRPDTLQQRTGGRVWTKREDAAELPQADNGAGVWARIRAGHDKHATHGSTSGTAFSANSWALQAGADMVLAETEAGRLVGGLSVQGGTASARVRSPHGNGTIDTTGFAVGATLTWYGANGFYADGQAQFSWYESDLHSATAGVDVVKGNRGKGHALSLEVGQRFALKDGWSLTPQAQFIYSSVDFDRFVDAFGVPVALKRGKQAAGRLGLAVNREAEWQGKTGRMHADLYGIANLYHDFSGGSKVGVDTVGFRRDGHTLRGGLGFGGKLSWGDGRYAVYGEANLSTDLEHFGDGNAVTGTLGLRIAW